MAHGAPRRGGSRALGPAMLRVRDVFVTHFLKSWNVRSASQAVGLTDLEGRRLIRDPWVQDAIKAAVIRIRDRSDLQAERVLTEAALLASLDAGRICDPVTGQVLALHEIPEDVRRCISSYETKTDPKTGEVKTSIKFWDKTRALELLAKCHKLVSERVDVNVTVGLADLILEAGGRVVDVPAIPASSPVPSGPVLPALESAPPVTLPDVVTAGPEPVTADTGGGAVGPPVAETADDPPHPGFFDGASPPPLTPHPGT